MASPFDDDCTHTVDPSTFLHTLKQDYLDDYVCSGGSAVKVVSGSDRSLNWLTEKIGQAALELRYLSAVLDPRLPDESGKRPDVHRIDRFFFHATRAVDWKQWAERQILRYFDEAGIRLTTGRSLSDLEGIAADNGRDPSDLLNQFQRELATTQIRDFEMAQEFRTAITALGRAQLIPDSVTPTTEEVIFGWLRGKTMPGAAAALKRIHIFERINQGNARFMLSSFCRWLPRAGCTGLVVVLDFRPYEHKRMPKGVRDAAALAAAREARLAGASNAEFDRILSPADQEPEISYSDLAYMQMLALIRRFIDEIDWFERFLLVILTTPTFYNPNSKRNYVNYDALQTRIALEVRDARRANPAAALVHLGDPDAA